MGTNQKRKKTVADATSSRIDSRSLARRIQNIIDRDDIADGPKAETVASYFVHFRFANRFEAPAQCPERLAEVVREVAQQRFGVSEAGLWTMVVAGLGKNGYSLPDRFHDGGTMTNEGDPSQNDSGLGVEAGPATNSIAEPRSQPTAERTGTVRSVRSGPTVEEETPVEARPYEQRLVDASEIAGCIKEWLESGDWSDDQKADFVANIVVLHRFERRRTAPAEDPEKLAAVGKEITGLGCGLTPDEFWDLLIVGLGEYGQGLPSKKPSSLTTVIEETQKPAEATSPAPTPISESAKTSDQPAGKRGKKSAVKAALESVTTLQPVIPADPSPLVTLAATPVALARATAVTMVPISEIRIGPNRRKLHDVKDLKLSIAEVGLMNPVTITKDNVLVAGAHRLEACRALGWAEIPVVYVDLDDMHLELAEIDENLMRCELTALERCEQLARRKAIYEALHPEAKAGSSEKQRQRGGGKPSETVSPGFSVDTAAKTGLTSRSVQQDVQIATDLPQEVRDAIRDTPLAGRKRDLVSLARLEPQAQGEVIARLADGRAKKFSEAMHQVGGVSETKAKSEKVALVSTTTNTEAQTEASDTTTPSPAAAVPPMDGLTDEAQHALDAVRDARDDPALSHFTKLVWLGNVITSYGFGGSETAATTAALAVNDHPTITTLAGDTGYAPTEVKACILLVAGMNRLSAEVQAEILGEAPAKAA